MQTIEAIRKFHQVKLRGGNNLWSFFVGETWKYASIKIIVCEEKSHREKSKALAVRCTVAAALPPPPL